jgi:hypothetical protein
MLLAWRQLLLLPAELELLLLVLLMPPKALLSRHVRLGCWDVRTHLSCGGCGWGEA